MDEHHLTVDGQRFRVHEGKFGGIAFDWLNGKNPGYGFGSSVSPDQPPTVEQLRASIRTFLAQVNPLTGYIEEDDAAR